MKQGFEMEPLGDQDARDLAPEEQRQYRIGQLAAIVANEIGPLLSDEGLAALEVVVREIVGGTSQGS